MSEPITAEERAQLEEEWLLCQRIMWSNYADFDQYWAAYDRSRDIELKLDESSD
jgi:hypothetical protein